MMIHKLAAGLQLPIQPWAFCTAWRPRRCLPIGQQSGSALSSGVAPPRSRCGGYNGLLRVTVVPMEAIGEPGQLDVSTLRDVEDVRRGPMPIEPTHSRFIFGVDWNRTKWPSKQGFHAADPGGIVQRCIARCKRKSSPDGKFQIRSVVDCKAELLRKVGDFVPNRARTLVVNQRRQGRRAQELHHLRHLFQITESLRG